MLWLLAEEMGVTVREDIHAMVPADRTKFPARVAWQARVTDRMHVAGAHALAHLETRGHRHVPPRMRASIEHEYVVGSERRDRLGRARLQRAALDLRARDQTGL